MPINEKQIAILRAVAAGSTLKAAGEALEVSATRAGQLLNRICKQLGLPLGVSGIHANPKTYLQKLDAELARVPTVGLRRDLVQRLVRILKLKSATELTPEYLSNISARMLLNSEITFVAIAEIQEWLLGHSRSLKRTPPETGKEITEAKRAIYLLDAFYFDTTNLTKQLRNLLEEDVE